MYEILTLTQHILYIKTQNWHMTHVQVFSPANKEDIRESR